MHHIIIIHTPLYYPSTILTYTHHSSTPIHLTNKRKGKSKKHQSAILETEQYLVTHGHHHLPIATNKGKKGANLFVFLSLSLHYHMISVELVCKIALLPNLALFAGERVVLGEDSDGS